ncbi:hypothetical protein ACOSP7_013378 [Xanthoceras sorbifolium]
MKCCSLKRKDLNFHFKKMSHEYYMLNGLNDELQAEIHHHMASTKGDLKNTSLGEIHQIALTSLEKISKFDKVCKKPYLQIKCKPDKCLCKTKKKKHFLPKEGRKNRRFRYF